MELKIHEQVQREEQDAEEFSYELCKRLEYDIASENSVLKERSEIIR